jgi:hypothetical protein
MWAVDWLAERWHKTASVVIDAQSPAMSLLPDLKAAHVKVTVTNMQEMGRACGRFLDMLKAGTLKHPRDEYQRSWPQQSRALPRVHWDSPARSHGTSSARIST